MGGAEPMDMEWRQIADGEVRSDGSPWATERVNIWNDGQCEFAGHVWVDAGGDLAVCMVCEAEKWFEPTDSEVHAAPSVATSRGRSET